MQSILNPLDIAITFDDRTYSLGETVRVEIRLAARRTVSVRSARLMLVLTATQTEIGRRQHRAGMTRFESGVGVSEPFGSDTASAAFETQTTHEFTGPEFITNREFPPDKPSVITARLEIPPELPSELSEESSGYGVRAQAKLSWSVDAVADVAAARNAEASVPIDVNPHPDRQHDGLTPEQRREKARQAAQRQWQRAKSIEPSEC